MQKYCADKLNFTLEEIKKNALSIDESALDCSFFNSSVKFYDFDGLSTALKDAAPYLKVVYICREKNFILQYLKIKKLRFYTEVFLRNFSLRLQYHLHQRQQYYPM